MSLQKPKVVIIGRPNVGKSTLFNRLVGKRIALVDDTPGVTRDRREGDARLFDLDFIAVDTAGLEEAGPETLSGRMRAQTEAALDGAAACLLVVDARQGLTPLDRHFAAWLRGADVPLVLVANKAEGRAGDGGIIEAFELGLGEPVAMSAEHGEGLADLYEALAPHVDAAAAVAAAADEAGRADAVDAPLRLAIVGRPNAGKSTLINRLLDEERLVTGPEAGITRDSIEIAWTWRDRPVRLIDTAGVRKRAKVQEKLEKLSVADTRRAIDFAEVVVLLLDATLGLEAQDLRIADAVLEEGRALVVALNKWDAAEDQSRLFQGVRKALEEGLAQIKGVPLLTVSGKTGKGLDTLIEVAFAQREAWSRRVATSALNRWFEAAIARNPPPAPGGKRIKLRYVTQARSRPPSFVVFGNRTDELPDSYVRYLVNSLREDLGFSGVPIRLNMRGGRNPYKPG
jgi:GTP-binding protein